MTLPATVSRAMAAAVVALGLTAGAALADPVTLDTASGPIKLPAVPKKVAVLDVAAIDTLTALGVKPAGISTPVYVKALEPKVKGIESVGTMFDVDMEKMAVLQPDLIIVGARALSQADMLKRIAPVADMSIGDDAIGDGEARLAAYGKLFGKQDKAVALKAELEKKLAAAKAAVAKAGGNALIVLTNGPKISAYGKESRFGWLHKVLGWPEAVKGITASNHGEPVSFEYIAQANPDTILVIDRGTTVGQGAEGAKQTLDNPLVHDTKAWKSGRIIYLPTAEAYVAGGGITSLMTTLDAITAKLSEQGS